MSSAHELLKNGVRNFRTKVYAENQGLYENAAATPQKPHTLFITCADSRIDPNEITGSGPGDVFVTRNIGNMVPAYGEMLGGVSAVIEYAVTGLGVEHIVVCGHTDCGAMKALLAPESVAAMPTVSRWLTNAHAALAVAERLNDAADSDAAAHPILERITEQNVLLQMQHLKTHPAVAGALAVGRLTISGWVYDIAKGNVSIAEDGEYTFKPLS